MEKIRENFWEIFAQQTNWANKILFCSLIFFSLNVLRLRYFNSCHSPFTLECSELINPKFFSSAIALFIVASLTPRLSDNQAYFAFLFNLIVSYTFLTISGWDSKVVTSDLFSDLFLYILLFLDLFLWYNHFL